MNADYLQIRPFLDKFILEERCALTRYHVNSPAAIGSPVFDTPYEALGYAVEKFNGVPIELDPGIGIKLLEPSKTPSSVSTLTDSCDCSVWLMKHLGFDMDPPPEQCPLCQRNILSG